MAGRYSQEQIADYENARDKWLERADDLTTAILTYGFAVEQAGEYARTGFARRIGSLQHAIQRMNEIYPPNTDYASRDQVRDAEMILQAFVMNVFGAIDNLAWVWARERDVRGKGGLPLYPAEIVFVGKRSGWLQQSLTPAVQAALENSKEWFDQIVTYRHGVAHQIPIYIPRLLSSADMAELEDLNLSIAEAREVGDTTRVLHLRHRQHNLGAYGAMMALSASKRPILLHPQMVCDLATVVALGETIMSEIATGES